jgi:undecaprenyl-diphosphatase
LKIWRVSSVVRTLAVLVLALAPATAVPSCNLSVIDHRVTEDAAGLWNPNVYRRLVDGLSVGQVGAALWEGSESRFGRTTWRGVDSELLAAGSTELLKRAFTRVRPANTDDPCRFFAHGSNHSFPAGEPAASAALVVPYVLEYGREQPAVFGLLALPGYVGVARIKARAHWQTDVLAGWFIGGLSGWYADSRATPLVVALLPDGLVLGLKRRF